METNILVDLGLTIDEATIYNVLLEGGFMPARTVALRANLGRPLTYKILDDLIVKSVVEKKETGGKISLFAPVHPRELEKLLEKKRTDIENTKRALDESIGQMVSKYNLFIGKPNVQFYEGLDGVKRVLEDTLLVPPETEIYTYADIEAITKYIPEINNEYSEKREKLKIKKKAFLLDTPKSRNLITDYHTPVTETKFINTDILEFETVMQIYENKVSYITLKENSMIGVIIEDASIYKMHKAVFEHFWKTTPETTN